MATQLTTSWQTLSTYRFEPGTGFKCDFFLEAKYTTQSLENNTTDTQFRLRSEVIQGQGSGYGYYFRLDYANAITGSGLWTLSNEIIVNSQAIISHNSDGTKTGGVSVEIRINGLNLNTTLIGEYTLPTISRYPMIIQSPDFSDEDNPTITYTTSLGFEGAIVEAGIFSSDGNTAYANYRQITVSDGTYTFNLTTTERNALRNATPNNNTLNIMYKIRTTTTNSVEYISSSIKKVTIVNANPTFTFTTTEINSNVSALLGTSATTIVQNASNVRIVVTPIALKGSTISLVQVVHNNVLYNDTSSPYSIDIPITTNNFTINVIDSRGNTTTETITRTLIEYLPVNITSLAMKRQNPTSSNVKLNLESVYYQKTFGSTANVPIVKWKVDDGSYTTIPSTEYSIDTTNNKLTISNYTLSNAIVYTSAGTITIEVSDKLTSYTDARNIIKGIATFDVGEHDLQVNGDLYVADTNRENEINVIEEINKKSENYNLITDGSEVKVGYKIDGKDVYAKRYTITNLGTNVDIPHGLTNFELIKWEASTLIGGTWRQLNYTVESAFHYIINVDSTNINYNATVGQNGTGKITLYYIYTN